MAPSPVSAVPSVSAQVSLLEANPPRPDHSTHLHALALEVFHNLRYQHNWSTLRLHNKSPITAKDLPRPLVSGLPPRRIYVHPDDQIEELKQGLEEKDAQLEREWVLPTRLREIWSLRRFAEIFNAIVEQPEESGHGVEMVDEQDEKEDGRKNHQGESANGQDTLRSLPERKQRAPKRVLLATVGDDSTIVYYIVHDGIVKPRQN